ncbi:hypothetical protein LJC32_00935 [Oscillospiraceae bacterium OttesenSCG-928-F05]|nr:hypothetical protein [Oscillospiraceae bacterium OttesenSCG-928-F05]
MMYEKFYQSRFARLYLWFAEAKYTMGIFFVAYVFFFLLLGVVTRGPDITLDLWTSIEMMFACFFIGVIQQALLTLDKLSRTRSVLWIISGALITLVFSLTFGWFEDFPAWCFVVFHIVMALGMGAMILVYYIDLNKETRLLNAKLEQFQNAAPGEGE